MEAGRFSGNSEQNLLLFIKTKENTIICLKAQITGKQDTRYIFVLVATE
jgi:hypothetical protein